jgi:hypothetical protein
MGGESGDIRVQATPVKTQLQMAGLDQMLRAALRSIQGYPLGMPWLGPYLESYAPYHFTLSGGRTKAWDPWANNKTTEEVDITDPHNEKKNPWNRRPPFRREEDTERGGRSGLSMVGQFTPTMGSLGTPRSISPVASSLINFYASPVSRLFTAPFVMPFYYPLSGNYPQLGNEPRSRLFLTRGGG